MVQPSESEHRTREREERKREKKRGRERERRGGKERMISPEGHGAAAAPCCQIGHLIERNKGKGNEGTRRRHSRQRDHRRMPDGRRGYRTEPQPWNRGDHLYSSPFLKTITNSEAGKPITSFTISKFFLKKIRETMKLAMDVLALLWSKFF